MSSGGLEMSPASGPQIPGGGATVYLNVTELFVDGAWGRVTVQTRERDCYGPEWWTIDQVLVEIPGLTAAHLWWWVGRRVVGAVLWPGQIPAPPSDLRTRPMREWEEKTALERVRFLVYAADLPVLRARLDDDRVADATYRLGGEGEVPPPEGAIL